ncbi:MAG: tryptophan--tRNA ligase [Chloroflexota bacterium]|nr:tryptophan--tRNA ligase [Chloroflexota bacterium]
MVQTVTREKAGVPQGADLNPRVLSGIQPSGSSHLGNYLGALRNWVLQQEQYINIFCIVDLHTLSIPIPSDTLRANTMELARVLLACGIDPGKSILFVQSDVREHAELCWILSSVTQFGELRRMTQFKEKSGGQGDAVSATMFFYPLLQAADILMYDADLVPVGEDQKQHIELTRDIALRFNARYGETFVIPQPDIKRDGARIMALDDPTKKMSKSSAAAGSYIALTDEPDVIRRKIMRAVTDSGGEVRAGEDKPALSNLLTIYSLLSGEPITALEDRYRGHGYGSLKRDLAEVVVEAIGPIQRRLVELEAQPNVVNSILEDGGARAGEIAAAKMREVRARIGVANR